MGTLIRYDVLSLDVWGHSADACEQWGCNGDCGGFEVNDRSRVGSIELPPDADDLHLLRALQAGHFLKDSVGLSEIAFDWNGEDSCNVDAEDTGMPLYQIERSR